MTTTAYITHPSFLKHEMGEGHPECPERLDAIGDYLLSHGFLDLMPSYQAPEVTHEQLLRVHTAHYLAEIENMVPPAGEYVHVDPDTLMNSHTLTAARHAAGAAVMATDLVLSGEVSSAFCAVRPPGHHAERDAAMGFCFFNNVAVGIRHAQRAHGINRIALIDFDVHHGNGSEDILAGDDEVLMVSTFQHPLYPYLGEVPKGTNMLNVPLPARTRGDALRQVVSERWLPALDHFRPQMIYISAGFDAHRDDDMANLGWVEKDYAWMTARLVEVAHRHSRGRIVSVLEGGYALHALAASVAAHVGVMLGAVDA
jgi:acetoin utilization deacetylase AcuC-like enzyme